MKSLFKITLRVAAAIMVCASMSACGQIGSSAGNFPSYSAQTASVGHFAAPTIMDY